MEGREFKKEVSESIEYFNKQRQDKLLKSFRWGLSKEDLMIEVTISGDDLFKKLIFDILIKCLK